VLEIPHQWIQNEKAKPACQERLLNSVIWYPSSLGFVYTRPVVIFRGDDTIRTCDPWISLAYPSHCVASIRVLRISRACDLEWWKCSTSKGARVWHVQLPSWWRWYIRHNATGNGRIIGFLSAVRRPLDSLDSRRPQATWAATQIRSNQK